MKREVLALETKQGAHRLLVFMLDGKQLQQMAAVARVEDEGEAFGYQRPEIVSHIKQIRRYLESENPMMASAPILALDSKRVRFKANGSKVDVATPGLLSFSWDENGGEKAKPAFTVDGQQRLAGFRDAQIGAFPVPVVAFFGDDLATQVEQFIICNSGRPLPKSLIYRLLPETEGLLPEALERRRVPAMLLKELNEREGSPFYHRITPSSPEGNIKDNSLLRALEHSLERGALVSFNPEGGEVELAPMLERILPYWTAVAEVFPEAWVLGPQESRLTHGVGIVSMGALFDIICAKLCLKPHAPAPSKADFLHELRLLAPACHWTSGEWEFEEGITHKWNDLQNTPRTWAMLTNYLSHFYMRAVAARKRR